MHERTRRLLCRLIFTLSCVLPTLALTVGTGIVRSPPYRAAEKAAWEERLTDELGLLVTLQAVRHPSRGATLLDGVALADPETSGPVAQVRQVEVGSYHGDLLLLASEPELQGDQVWRLWEAVSERLLRGRRGSSLRLHLLAGNVTLHRAGKRGASTLTDVRCRLAPTDEGPQLALEFRDVALQMSEPAQLRITRNRRLSPPATRWELQTRSTALPCSLLADRLEILDRLGARAAFQGDVQVLQTAAGWEGTLRGRFHEVDLDQLVTDHYDHKLSGFAAVQFDRAAFQGGKLIDAAGELTCPGGQVSWSLLDQAAKSLGLAAEPRVGAMTADVQCQYRELRFGFTLDIQGLSLVGLCGSGGQGVILVDAQGPLLRERPQEVAPVALVRALCSKNGEAVPATAEAYQLLHVLPIPAPTAAAPPRPYSPLRLQDPGTFRR